MAADPSQDYLYAVDSTASRLLKIPLPLAQSSKNMARIVAGDWMGTSGFRDGWGEQALLDHPKGLAVDDDGNVYVADVTNRIIRKISPAGYVSTIAGQLKSTGHVDGEGKNARFSSDFDLTYLPKICSLVICDRGNRRVRMIQLKSPDRCGVHWRWGAIISGLFSGVFLSIPIVYMMIRVFQKLLQQRITAEPVVGGGDRFVRGGTINGCQSCTDKDTSLGGSITSSATALQSERSVGSENLIDFPDTSSQEGALEQEDATDALARDNSLDIDLVSDLESVRNGLSWLAVDAPAPTRHIDEQIKKELQEFGEGIARCKTIF